MERSEIRDFRASGRASRIALRSIRASEVRSGRVGQITQSSLACENILIFKNSELSCMCFVLVHERGGRTSSRTADRDAVDVASVGARGEGQGGRRIEPNPVSARIAQDERRSCVRQNRVVLSASAVFELLETAKAVEDKGIF
jgi:hypothetical protein